MALGNCPHWWMGKVTLLPIFPLSFSYSVSNINAVLLSTVEHYKISGNCFKLSSAALNWLVFCLYHLQWNFVACSPPYVWLPFSYRCSVILLLYLTCTFLLWLGASLDLWEACSYIIVIPRHVTCAGLCYASTIYRTVVTIWNGLLWRLIRRYTHIISKDLDIDHRIIVKWILGVMGVDWIHPTQVRDQFYATGSVSSQAFPPNAVNLRHNSIWDI
jgi:hypothetical protein